MIWYLNGQALQKNQACAVPLGVQGENGSLSYTCDASDWLASWPQGVIALVLQAPDESDPYVGDTSLNRETGIVTWNISAYDTAQAGYGKGELRIVENDVVKKSYTFITYTKPSILSDAAEPPAPTPEWIAELLETASEVQGVVDAAEAARDAAINAKNAAQVAQEGAAGSENNAQASADAAAASESNALLYANRAEAAAHAADISKTEAAGFAESASANKTAAEEAAANAATAQAAAYNSADMASAAATSAIQVADDFGAQRIEWTKTGKCINTTGATVDKDSYTKYNGNCAVVPCQAGDQFTITARGTATYGAWTFIQSDGTKLTCADGLYIVAAVITAPENAAYLVINNYLGDASYRNAVSYYGDSDIPRIKSIASLSDTVDRHTLWLLNARTVINMDGYLQYDGRLHENGTVAHKTSDYIRVKTGDVLRYKLYRASNEMLVVMNDAKRVLANTTGSGNPDAVIETTANAWNTGTYTFTADGYFRVSTPAAYVNECEIFVDGYIPDAVQSLCDGLASGIDENSYAVQALHSGVFAIEPGDESVSATKNAAANKTIQVAQWFGVQIPEGTLFSVYLSDTARAEDDSAGLEYVNYRYWVDGDASQRTLGNSRPIHTETFFVAPENIVNIGIYVTAAAVRTATTLQLTVRLYPKNAGALNEAIAPDVRHVANTAYDAGDFLISGGTLYKALGKININDALVEETNVVKTSIADELEERMKTEWMAVSMFSDIGVIGDSFSSGSIHSSNTASEDAVVVNYNVSWPQILARRTGANVVNYTKSGLSTRAWLTNSDRGLPKLLSDINDASIGPRELYIIALAINDYSASADPAYLGTINDVHVADFTQNPDTFYGNYGRIIGNILASASGAKVICLGSFTGEPGTRLNGPIQDVANAYGVPYLNPADDAFFAARAYNDMLIGGHPTAYGYAGMAAALERLINRCVLANTEYFKNFHGHMN